MTEGHAAKRSAVLCASGSLGLTPFHPESFWAGVARRPDVVAADAGSGDIGPFYLGSGHWYNLREWENQDLSTMLKGARSCGARMIVGSAGGAGLDQAVDLYFELVNAAIRRENLGPLRVARIYSEVTKDWLRDHLKGSAPLGAPWPLTEEIIDETSSAVAMIGVEPYLRALDEGADVILAGRSCDDVLFAAHPIWVGLDRGLALHMGKCIECGPLVATPPLQRESVIGWTQAFGSLGGLMVTGMYYLVVTYGQHLPAIVGGHEACRYTLMSGIIPALPLIVIRPFLPESPMWQEKKRTGTLKRPSFGELTSGRMRE